MTNASDGVAAPPIPPGWWHRNWKWVLPVGVFACLAALAAFVGAIVFFVFTMFKGSDVYADAVAQARSNPAVVRELGEPVEPRWWVIGSIQTSTSSGSADFAVPLRGPSGRATLYVAATKRTGRWRYTVLQVAIDGKTERIDLLADWRR